MLKGRIMLLSIGPIKGALIQICTASWRFSSADNEAS